MDKFSLTEEETTALSAVAEILRTLPTHSQYNVLRNVAHLMNREVVSIGSVRAAAAVAGSVARVQVSEKPGKSSLAKPGKIKEPSKKVTYTPGFLALPATKALLAEQEAAKAALSSPPKEAERTRLRAASKALREAWCVHRGAA